MTTVHPRGERVLVEVGNTSTTPKPAVALRLEKTGKAPVEKAKLVQKMVDAEVRRDIEIEAIKYRAQQCSTKKTTPKATPKENVEEALNAKITKAAERREAALSAKKQKAEEMAMAKGKKDDGGLSKVDLDVKMQNATARKAELTYRKVEAAAALGTERCLTAAITRLKAEAADEAQRSDMKTALEMNLSETSRRKELLLAEIVYKASRSGGSGKVAAVNERLEQEKAFKAQILAEKMDRAMRLKKDHDQKLIETAITSTGKIVKAKSFREANDQGRRVALQDTLDAKSDKASQRREMEQLDKVVKAASLGSAAVLTASAKRDSRLTSEKILKETRLETKLQAHAKRYEKSVSKVVEKASKENEKVADVAKFHSQRIETNERDDQPVKPATTPPKKKIPHEARATSADRRRELNFENKVTIATQLGTDRVKTVLTRKTQLDQEEKRHRQSVLDEKQKAAEVRRAKQIESTRRGLNGKRNPDAPLPPLRQRSQDNSSSYTYTILGASFGAALAVFGACVARFST